jgi:DNA-binding NarL/FixJ family response regulator
VLRLIARGLPLAQIAEQLHLSPKTVTTHKAHLMSKLGIANNADLIRFAVEHKLSE